MTSLILAVFVFAAVVGVKYKAHHQDSDLPDSVISGSKEFFQELLVVIKSSVPAKKEKPAIEEKVVEPESEEKPTE